MKEANFTAWHFLPSTRRLRFGDERQVVPGETLAVNGRIELRSRGLHWARQPLKALTYAAGLHVELTVPVGDIIEREGLGVSQGRKTLWIADATAALRAWARWCALEGIDLWPAPDLVRQYLQTGEAARHARAGQAAWAANSTYSVAREAQATRAEEKARNDKLTELLMALHEEAQ